MSNYFNHAAENSTVGMQAGSITDSEVYTTIFQEQHLHGDSTNPDDVFNWAVDLLKSDVPRRAEPIIRQLVDQRAYRLTHRVAYYWTLAVLSGRTYTELSEDDYQVLHSCGAATADVSGLDDMWRNSLDVVYELLAHIAQQDSSASSDEAQLYSRAARLSGLPGERREEIFWHMSMVIDGATRDHLDVQRIGEVKDKRLRRNRTDRAWKFFEPIPEPPRQRPDIQVTLETGAQIGTAIGVTVAAIGFALALTVYAALGIPVLLAASAALIVGTPAAVYFGAVRLAARERLADEDRRHGLARPYTRYSKARPNWSGGYDERVLANMDPRAARKFTETWALFLVGVPFLVAAWFSRVAPPPNQVQKSRAWSAIVGTLIGPIVQEIFETYSNPLVEPGKISWLVHWRVKQIRDRWEVGELYSYQRAMKVSTGVQLAYYAALAMISSGLLAVIIGFAAYDARAAAVFVLLALAVWILRAASADKFLVDRQRRLLDRQDISEQLSAERQAFAGWNQVLADRPLDWEMAEWLEWDKEYLILVAIQLYRITRRELITAPLTLTEPDIKNNVRRARVVGRPPRYSHIIVTQFLLTSAGVREVAFDLDFCTAEASDPRRMTFGYDAITYARVEENSVGLDRELGPRNHPQQSGIPLDYQRPGYPPQDGMRGRDGNGRLIVSQSFTVALTNSAGISVRVENFDAGFVERMLEDPQTLTLLALDPSGINTACHILEAIAVEGRDWIAHEKARVERRLENFQRRHGAGTRPFALTGARELAGPDPEPDEADLPGARSIEIGGVEIIDQEVADIDRDRLSSDD